MRTKLVVVGLIENDKNQFLISQRFEPTIKDAHMKWDFVGGKIEFGETPEEALKREVMEETGLDVKVKDMVPCCYSNVWNHDDFKIHALVICYRCKVLAGECNISDRKINDLKWISKDEFKNYDFLPTIDLFLKKINFFEK